MDRRRPKAKPNAMGRAVGVPAGADSEGSRGNAAAPALGAGAAAANPVSVDSGLDNLISHDQYQRIIRACKNRPDILFDVAMVLEGKADEASVEQVLEGYDLFAEDLPILLENPVTGPQIEALRTDIREHGLGFRRKAAAMAEAFLPRVATIVNDADTAPQVRLQGISQLAKWGGLEKSAQDNGAGGVSVVINFPDLSAPVKVIKSDG